MPTIDCDFKDPIDTDVTTGLLTFIAEETNPPLLKSTFTTIVPGNDIDLLAGEYKVYYTHGSTGIKHYIGTITVSGDATLVSLLVV